MAFIFLFGALVAKGDTIEFELQVAELIDPFALDIALEKTKLLNRATIEGHYSQVKRVTEFVSAGGGSGETFGFASEDLQGWRLSPKR